MQPVVINAANVTEIISADTGNITCNFRISGPELCGYMDISKHQSGWILRELVLGSFTNSSITTGNHNSVKKYTAKSKILNDGA